MHLKDKLRKAFTPSANSSPTREHSEQLVYRPAEPRWPSNVYRWDEPLPRLKYRGPVKIEHKKKLEAYTLGFHSPTPTAQRRRSHMSDHSPMSSRIQSRRSSISSQKNRNSLQARRASQSLRVRTSITAASAVVNQHTPPSAASPREHKRHMRESLFINASAANTLSSSSTHSSPFGSDPNSPTYPLSPTSKLPVSPMSPTSINTSSSTNSLRFSKQFQADFILSTPITPPKSPNRRKDLVVDTSFGTHHGTKANVFRSQNPQQEQALLTPVTPRDGRLGELFAH